MLEPIVFPDAETLLIDELVDILGEDVRSSVPADRVLGDRFVIVQRVGGVARDEVIDDATIGFEAWAEGRTAACDLIQLVRAHVRALVGSTIGGVPVSRVRDIGGPAWQPDPDSTHPRYVYTAAVTLKGSALVGS